MNRNFKYQAAPKPEPIYFEQIFAEKPGGGMAANPSYTLKKTTAMAKTDDDKYIPIKAYRVVEKVEATATTIKVAKGSGVAKGDFIATGTKAVEVAKVDTTTSDDFDVVTIKAALGEIKADKVLYQAKQASDTAAEPIYTPMFVLGTTVEANEGDYEVRLINGANLRKETANIASEVAALLPMITLV